MGVHLSDLTFMDEGNPDFLDVRVNEALVARISLSQSSREVKLINFPKHHLVSRSISELLRFQNMPYSMPPKGMRSLFTTLIFFSASLEPLYTYLKELPGLMEKELYDLSLDREPRNSQLKDIE